ncbi:MAG: DciA family protein, partial [Pseudomonadota bacterium]
EIAAIARPVQVGYAQGGFGATLTVLTTGAQAPMLDMQKEQIRQKVNAVYGYKAISRVRITQTAPTGFAEGQVQFEHRPVHSNKPDTPEIEAEAKRVAEGVTDLALRDALHRLARNVLTKEKN